MRRIKQMTVTVLCLLLFGCGLPRGEVTPAAALSADTVSEVSAAAETTVSVSETDVLVPGETLEDIETSDSPASVFSYDELVEIKKAVGFPPTDGVCAMGIDGDRGRIVLEVEDLDLRQKALEAELLRLTLANAECLACITAHMPAEDFRLEDVFDFEEGTPIVPLTMYWALEMTLSENCISASDMPASVTVSVKSNESERDFFGGRYYRIEHFENNQWVPVCRPAVTEDEICIPAGGTYTFAAQLTADDTIPDFVFAPGEYRVSFAGTPELALYCNARFTVTE